MAKTLSKTGITNGQTIQPSHVTQSIDAFTGTEAYDITLSGSLTLTGNQSVTGSLIVSNSITSSALTSDGSNLLLGYSGSNYININDGSSGITIDAEGKLIELIGRSNLTLASAMALDNASTITLNASNIITLSGSSVLVTSPITASGNISSSAAIITNELTSSATLLSGSLTLNVNGGYQMTASSGNYTSVMDIGTGALPNGSSLTNVNGSITTFYGTYVPITSSLAQIEAIADSVLSASGFLNEVKYGVDVNQQFCTYQDFSPFFSNPPGTNVNFVNQLGSVDDGDTNYGVTTGDNVFAGGAKGVYIQGNDASGVGAFLIITESQPSGFVIGSNSVNTTGSDLLTIKRDSDSAEFFKTRNDGMIILAQLSSSFSASDDADAATKGVPTGGLYHTNGTVKIRLS